MSITTNNFGAKYADGDYFLLLNNDTEVITPEWLENMMGYCQREDVGIVGAKLLYPCLLYTSGKNRLRSQTSL